MICDNLSAVAVGKQSSGPRDDDDEVKCDYMFWKQYFFFLLGLPYDRDYLILEYNKEVHGIPENDPNKKDLPNDLILK